MRQKVWWGALVIRIMLGCLIVWGVLGCGEHPSRWEQSMQLSREAIEQGNYQQAESLLLTALEEAKQWGDRDVRLATTLHQLGELYRLQGKFDKAELFFWRALPVWVASVGPYHLKMVESMTQLAQLFQDQQQYDKAEPLLQQALVFCERLFGTSDPRLLPALEKYAALLHVMHRQRDAQAVERRMQAIRDQGQLSSTTHKSRISKQGV
ncbi:MAG: tetratricopeptide repeat protein [Nitrospirae bacterium]|nr:MAG: tetratricopeptide repeat protein [Nitrospirota bacterium]